MTMSYSESAKWVLSHKSSSNAFNSRVHDILSKILGNASDGDSRALVDIDTIERFFDKFKIYYTAFLIVFGIMANVICLIQCIVKSRGQIWESTWTHYVVSICVADFSALTILAAEWTFHVILGKPQSNVVCKLTTFLGYLGTFLCPWLILLMTIERFMVVRTPLRRNRIVNVKRVRSVLLLVFGASFLFNVWTLTAYRIEMEPGVNTSHWYCAVGSFRSKAVWDCLNLVCVFILPSAAILQLNLSIGILLVRQRQRYYRKNAIPKSSTQKVRQTDSRTARKLLLISLLYIIFNGPFYAIKVSSHWNVFGSYRYRVLVTEASQLLLMSQYVCHCFIYSNFVKEAVSMVRESGNGSRAGSRVSSMTPSFYHRDSVLTSHRPSAASITLSHMLTGTGRERSASDAEQLAVTTSLLVAGRFDDRKHSILSLL